MASITTVQHLLVRCHELYALPGLDRITHLLNDVFSIADRGRKAASKLREWFPGRGVEDYVVSVISEATKPAGI